MLKGRTIAGRQQLTFKLSWNVGMYNRVFHCVHSYNKINSVRKHSVFLDGSSMLVDDMVPYRLGIPWLR